METERKNIRLQNFNYGSSRAYFVTICTKNREHLFGKVVGGRLTTSGQATVVSQCWQGISSHYPQVELDEFVIMPNHVHGILWINEVGDEDFRPLLGNIVKGFKIGVTKWFRANTDVYEVWQRSYHDRVIRDEKELNTIREYIRNNLNSWEEDDYF